MGVDLGGLDAGVPGKLLQHTQIGATRMHGGVAKACRSTCSETRSGLARPAATAASLISRRAAWRLRALAPLRTEWNSQGEGAPPE